MAQTESGAPKTFKQQAADHAVEFIRSGMVVGLGTGSTAIFATRRIAGKLRDGTLRDIVGIATSIAVQQEAARTRHSDAGR